MTAIASTTRSTTSGTARLARGRVRPALLVAGAALTAAAAVTAAALDTGVSSVLVFAVLPDLAFLLALGQRVERGQLARRAVPAYNLLHRPAVPVALLALAASGVLGEYWLVAGLAWGAHIALDRGCGYGLRTADGWQRG